jgi:hypothetical protein
MKEAIVGSFIGCPGLINTLTVGNGSEFGLHDKITEKYIVFTLMIAAY